MLSNYICQSAFGGPAPLCETAWQQIISLVTDPVQDSIDWLNRWDGENWVNKGNYISLTAENDPYEIPESDIKFGAIPLDISGVYLRNGPNVEKPIPSKRYGAWDGDGMVHAIRIQDGKLHYANHATQTPRYMQEKEYDRELYVRLSEMPGQYAIDEEKNYNLVKMMWWGVEQVLGSKPYVDMQHQGSANTAFITHAKKTYAVYEVTYPFGLKFEHTAEGFGVSSLGYQDLNGELSHGITAHPKVDTSTGELFAFGYGMMDSTFNYSRFDKEQKLLNHLQFPLTSVRMIHDFMVTENFVIIPDLPMEMKMMDAVTKGESMFQLNTDQPTRYGVTPKNATSPDQIIWFDLAKEDGHYAFHFANAKETVDENGDQIIVFHAPTMTAFGSYFVLQSEHPLYQNKEEAQHMWEFKLNLSTGGYTIEKHIPEKVLDFLMINNDYLGKDYQYIYMTTPSMELSDKAIESYQDGGFIKYDVNENRIIGEVTYENEGQAGEVQFVPRVNSTAEDDGYLMTFVYDPTIDQTNFQMWDAHTLEPVLTVGTKQRVPHGMHGTWVNSEDLEIDQLVY